MGAKYENSMAIKIYKNTSLRHTNLDELGKTF